MWGLEVEDVQASKGNEKRRSRASKKRGCRG